MHRDHDLFLDAIHRRHRVRLTFFSKEDEQQLVRMCAPMDYGTTRIAKDNVERYHFWDFDSDSESGNHPLMKEESEIIEIADTSDLFDPGEFVTWSPDWHVPRDWGPFS